MTVDDHFVHMENGILHADSPRSKIDQMLSDALSVHSARPIVIHFHGGLVSYDTGIGTAKRLLPYYEDAGGFPVFFVWESGLLETIRNNLGEVAKETFFKIVWKRVRSIIARKLLQIEGARSAGDLPQLTDDATDREIEEALAVGDVTALMGQKLEGRERLEELTPEEVSLLEAELQFDFELTQEVQRISNALRDPTDIEADRNSRSASTVRSSTVTLMDPDAVDQFVERPDPSARGLISAAKIMKAVVKIAARTISRYVRGRDHGLHATIVEEILHALYLGNVGGIIWSTMKKDTSDSFGPDGQAHGGTAFLEALRQASERRHTPRVVLVGHSAGAVYISELIKKADELLPDEFKFEVVFLAPASTFKLIAGMVADFPHRISGFRMFSMTDGNEKGDALVPVLYPHSLLYFVSGVVESEVDMPIVGMHRFYDSDAFPESRFPAVETFRAYLAQVADGAVWSITDDAGPGKNSTSLKHGDFDNDELTVASVCHLIREGF